MNEHHTSDTPEKDSIVDLGFRLPGNTRSLKGFIKKNTDILIVVVMIIAAFVVLIYFIGRSALEVMGPSQTNSFQVTPAIAVLPTTATIIEPIPTIVPYTPFPTLTQTPDVVLTAAPIATRRPTGPTPTPTLIPGIDLAVHGATFDATPNLDAGEHVYRYPAQNGGNYTIANDRNADHLEVLVSFANRGTDEAKDIKIVYFVDDVQIAEGLTYLPGGMFNSDTANPKIPSSGTHTVRIEIDPEKKLNDVNRANNTFKFTYTMK